MKIVTHVFVIGTLFINFLSLHGIEKERVYKKVMQSRAFWAVAGMVCGCVGTAKWWMWKLSHEKYNRCWAVAKTFDTILENELDNNVYGYDIQITINNELSNISRGNLNVTDAMSDSIHLNRDGDSIKIFVKYKKPGSAVRVKMVPLWNSYRGQFNGNYFTAREGGFFTPIGPFMPINDKGDLIENT